MLRIFGKRIAIFGICLTMGAGLILGTGAPALAAEATLKGAPSNSANAAIAVPNFLAYRNKSRVASAVGTGESIRASMANFAADIRVALGAKGAQAKPVETTPDMDAEDEDPAGLGLGWQK